jgi:hypothetical protein
MALAVRGLRLRGSQLGHPSCHANCAPYPEADPEFQIVVNPATARIHRPKAISQNAMSSVVDNSITIQDVREYLTLPLASSDRSRCC